MQPTWLAASGTASSVIYHICFFGPAALAVALAVAVAETVAEAEAETEAEAEAAAEAGPVASHSDATWATKGTTYRKTRGCICLSFVAIVIFHWLYVCVGVGVL